MISHIQNITTANTTARIFELKEEKDFGGMRPCFLVDFLDAEGNEMLDVAWEYPTLKEAKEHITEVLEGLAAG
jgi:hypothetical protein